MSDRKKINKHFQKPSEMRRYLSCRVTNPALSLRDGNKRNLRKYIKRVTGTASFSNYMLQSFMFTLWSDLPTVWASILRAKVYRRVLGSVGSSCFIERNVRFYVPQKIFLGDRVFIGENNYFDANNLKCEIRLEDDVHIGRNGTICIVGSEGESTSDKILIHKNTAINAYNFLCSSGGIEIGKYCMLGFDVAILGGPNDHSQTGRIKIGTDVWIGAHVTILPGVTIGEGSVIGAGALVTNDIPRYSIAVGFPAKVIGKRE